MSPELEIKKNFEKICSNIKSELSELSSIPESLSFQIDVLISLSQLMFTINSNQIKDLRKSIDTQTNTVDKQTQTIDKQIQTIDEQNATIQTLIEELAEAHQEKLKNDEIINTLKKLLKSKAVDLDALKQLLFQEDREQKNDSTTTITSNKNPKSDNKKNKSKSKNDKTIDGDTLKEENLEDASKKISTVEDEEDSVKPGIIMGYNPEEEFLPNTLVGFNLMGYIIEERIKKKKTINRIVKYLNKKLPFTITSQQIAKYFIYSADWVQLAFDYLKERVLSSRIIHIYESFIPCLEDDNIRLAVLVFSSDNGTFFHYTNSKNQKIPLEILQNNFDGDQWVDNNGDKVVISTDYWYDLEWLRDPKGNYKTATPVGCMIHLRQYFWNVYHTHGNHIDMDIKKDSEDYRISEQIVNHIEFIFHKDKECQTVEERTQTRMFGEVREKFDEIKRVIDEICKKISECKNASELYTPKFIKAVKYARNQWEKISRIMEDGNITLNNSNIEKDIRDLSTLKHSTTKEFASIKGAESVAVFSSFHETCKKFGVPLGKYLEFLFRNMGIYKHKVNNDNMSLEEKNKLLESSMPWNFKKV